MDAMTVKPVFLSSSMLPRKSMSSFSSYNFFICTVEMNEGFICIYQQFNSICFITCAILKASVFLDHKARKCTMQTVRSEAGITTSHISLSRYHLNSDFLENGRSTRSETWGTFSMFKLLRFANSAEIVCYVVL